MATQPVSFDAPLQSATTVSVATNAAQSNGAPAGVTFDSAPTSQAVTVAVPSQANQPQAQPQQSTGIPTGTLRAAPQPSGVAANVEQWADDVKNDLLNGTGTTKVGALLKFLGAPGLGKGVPLETADFMGSPLLGPTRIVQGASELPQSGKRWTGTKNVVGGALDTATIPGGFISPEAGELAGTGTEAALDAASNAAKATKGLVSAKALQPKVQGAITSAIQDAAAEHGVTIPEKTNLRDVTQALSNSLRAKAHGLYQQLDNALGGTRFQSFEEAIDNVKAAIRDEAGLDPDRDKLLSQRLADAKAARDAAVETAQSKGVSPDTITQADVLHRKAMALGDVSKAVRASTDVHPSQVANGASDVSSTQVRTKQLWNRMQQLATPNPKYPGSPSRLIQALGEDRAAQLLHDVDAAHLAAQKIAARNAWIKRGAAAVGLTGAGAAGYHLAHELLSGQ